MAEQLNWEVVKNGKWSGWTIHSRHATRELAEAEAARLNIWTDAQFSVRNALAVLTPTEAVKT